MLKILLFTLKVAVISLVALVLGNVIEWRGKTLSDQIKTQMSQAEHWVDRSSRENPDRNSDDSRRHSEEFLSTEREKLRTLIRELNRARGGTY